MKIEKMPSTFFEIPRDLLPIEIKHEQQKTTQKYKAKTGYLEYLLQYERKQAPDPQQTGNDTHPMPDKQDLPIQLTKAYVAPTTKQDVQKPAVSTEKQDDEIKLIDLRTRQYHPQPNQTVRRPLNDSLTKPPVDNMEGLAKPTFTSGYPTGLACINDGSEYNMQYYHSSQGQAYSTQQLYYTYYNTFSQPLVYITPYGQQYSVVQQPQYFQVPQQVYYQNATP